MTLVVLVWMKEKHASAKYLLIVNKGLRFLLSQHVDFGAHHERIKAMLE